MKILSEFLFFSIYNEKDVETVKGFNLSRLFFCNVTTFKGDENNDYN